MKIKTYEDGSARLLWDWRDIALTTANFAALREFFQAERDEELGRWRDPENPDMVVYPRPDQDDSYGRCMSLFDESSGEFWLAWERIATHDSSARYFAAHPEPKPWDTARPDDLWVLSDGDREEVFRCGEHGLYQLKTGNPLCRVFPILTITGGRRIWPEGEAS